MNSCFKVTEFLEKKNLPKKTLLIFNNAPSRLPENKLVTPTDDGINIFDAVAIAELIMQAIMHILCIPLLNQKIEQMIPSMKKQ